MMECLPICKYAGVPSLQNQDTEILSPSAIPQFRQMGFKMYFIQNVQVFSEGALVFCKSQHWSKKQ
jgi:hypothetical protein